MISIDNIDEASAVKRLLSFAGYELGRCPVCGSEIAGRELKKNKMQPLWQYSFMENMHCF